ncbi:CNNM domain-containing protein [Ileibacterium valens]|uniref:CNNM domain-containing protein n=2 Tax=Ileibacterium valens TaxID=1862668 RepID=UPI001178CA1F|nr:CNNM domain-containing protein [Ileibacterium valens]
MLLIISLEFWLTGIGIGLPYHVLDTIVILLITMILSYFTLVFGELVPKQIAIHKSEQMALGVSGLISGIAFLFSPLVKVLTWSTNTVLRVLGINPNSNEEEVFEEEIIMMVNAGEQKGTIDTQEKDLIECLFAFDDRQAKDIMVHRTEMILLDLDNPDGWDHAIYETKRAFIPVFSKTADHILSILNVKKLLRN